MEIIWRFKMERDQIFLLMLIKNNPLEMWPSFCFLYKWQYLHQTHTDSKICSCWFSIQNTRNCVAMWRRFYFLMKTSQQCKRHTNVFLFSFLRHVCAAKSKAVSQNWRRHMFLGAKTHGDRLFDSLAETKQNANQPAMCVCASSKKQKASRSHLPRASLLRERDACELKQEIARNVPGMHALYMQPRTKNKKRSPYIQWDGQFPINRVAPAVALLWRIFVTLFFFWFAQLIHKNICCAARFPPRECMRCGRYLHWIGNCVCAGRFVMKACESGASFNRLIRRTEKPNADTAHRCAFYGRVSERASHSREENWCSLNLLTLRMHAQIARCDLSLSRGELYRSTNNDVIIINCA